MTDKQKLEKLHELGVVMSMSKDKESQFIRDYAAHVLDIIEECHESWCDSCPIIKETGKLCCDWLE